MAYRADIEIVVKGAKELSELSERIGRVSKQIADVNKTAKLQNAIPASVNNYKAAVQQATAAVNASVAGTTTQKRAIDVYVKSLVQAEKAERNLAAAIKQRQRELGVKPTGLGGASLSRGSRIGGVASNALIGGSFPLLFGQGGAAAAGGAIGGAVGGLFGGTGGFAGSLLGTLVGQLAGQANKIKDLANDIGFTAQQTAVLSGAFKQAGVDFDKFEQSVQNIRGLGLSLNDQANAVKLVSTLTETYGGKIDKVTNAFTGALEQGKVTQATLNQLTSQGIPIQDALAQKYNVSRDAILKMAKDGTISVQALTDTLVSMGNEGLRAGEKPKTAFEQFNTALAGTATAVGNVAGVIAGVLAPAIDAIIIKATLALNALTEVINTELLRTKIQGQTNKILGPQRLQAIDKEAMDMAARRYPSTAKGRQLAAGANVISPRAQQEFQIIREQLIRNELKRFGYEQGILSVPRNVPTAGTIDGITAPSQAAPSGGGRGRKPKDLTEQRQQQLEAAARMAVESEYELRAQVAITDQEKLQNNYDKARLERMTKYETLYRKALSSAEIEYLLTAQRSETLKATIAYEQEKAVLLKKEVEDMYRLLDVAELLDEVTQRRLGRAFGMTGGAFRTDINLDPNNQGIKQLDVYNAELQILTERLTLAKNGAEAIGDAFSNSFQGIVNGTQTTQQALQQFFQQVAQAFNAMAAEIIAKMITMYVFKSVLGIFGSTAKLPNFSGNLGSVSNNTTTAFSGVQLYAEGGFVTGPTRAVVGEGGEPEYVIPASKMRSAMNRYASGARGSAVIPAGSDGGDGMATTSAPTGAIDVRYTVERINSVDYVTADQFQRGMQQAAAQGAAQGEQRTLRRLQSSTSTRKRLGM